MRLEKKLLALLGSLSLAIAAMSCQRPVPFTIRARFRDVKELRVGAPVEVAGVTVGKVTAIDRGTTAQGLVTMEITVTGREHLIPSDAKASLAQAGMLGEYYVQIDIRQAHGSPIKAGGELPTTND